MKRRLPPLNALRAFEAGAHHLNFTRAADSLAVTPTAISHQVRQLEDWFGKPLFQRGGKQLTLTEAGSQLYPVIAEALDRINEVACRIRDSQERAALTVSVTPTFGTRWLATRLGRFWELHQDVDLRIHHSVHLVDLARDDIDLAIRWGLGSWNDCCSERLMDAVTMPLCSPKLLQGPNPLREISDLTKQVLLHDQVRQEWIEWLVAAGLDDSAARRGPVVGDPNSLVSAAIEGHGVFLGPVSMMSAEIASGALIAPFAGDDGPAPAYFLVYLEKALEKPAVKAFREFILAETKYA
ncbi:MAG: LysR family transcriptional regulator [marine bacterium B5-7]|nr:MAG: LysR family transcriptional regulator [marine bacterium B5-7]